MCIYMSYVTQVCYDVCGGQRVYEKGSQAVFHLVQHWLSVHHQKVEEFIAVWSMWLEAQSQLVFSIHWNLKK